MITAYIGLGSNLHEPIRQLRAALHALARLPDSQLAGISSVYRSAAVGPGKQADYLNAVMRLETALAPDELLQQLHRIEHDQGRVREVRWGARSLDLDILLYGSSSLATPSLTIPHPSMDLRNFVLYPLAEIAGMNLVLPDGTELGTLIAGCPQGGLTKTGLQLRSQDATAPGELARQETNTTDARYRGDQNRPEGAQATCLYCGRRPHRRR